MRILGYIVEAILIWAISVSYNDQNNNNLEKTTIVSSKDQATPPMPTGSKKALSTKLPNEKILNCQFYAQAPRWNWRAPFEDYCEEASVILWVNCLNNEEVNIEKFESQLSEIDTWFTDKFWKSKDQTVKQMAQAIKEKYDLEYEIIDNPSFKDIQTAINSWNLVVAPLAWKMLKNPHYKNGWPNFHALLVVGYKKDKVITNDVWTRSWKNYEFKKDIFMNALHDYVSWDIKKWEKRILVIKKKK